MYQDCTIGFQQRLVNSDVEPFDTNRSPVMINQPRGPLLVSATLDTTLHTRHVVADGSIQICYQSCQTLDNRDIIANEILYPLHTLQGMLFIE